MDTYPTNGHAAELAQYETPFADLPITKEARPQKFSESNFISTFLGEHDSPFARTFETAPADRHPAGEEFVSLLGELNDAEFNETLYELAAEVEDTWSGKISSEVAMGNNYIPFIRQQARGYFEPLAMEAESMIDKVTAQFSGNNLADFTAAEIESYFQTLPFNHARFTPVQEQFLGGLFNKVKSVVKKGVDLAKKGISAVGKILPVNIILDRIKGLVRPLLDKVLGFAIGKLPKNLQPYAQSLAKKFLKMETGADPDNSRFEQTPDVIQTELDNNIAQLVFSNSEHESQFLVGDYEVSFETIERTDGHEGRHGDMQALHQARENFINELKNLQPGENPAPVIERFLPAAILALQPVIKMAISVIGRQNVINFLAGLLAKLVSKYVPENVAQPLAANIIDVGMSAIGFETYEMQKPDLAYEAIANTIEDTVQHLNTLDEAALADQETLTMHLFEAFEKAAAANFPPQYIRESLRPTKQRGLWVMMPRSGPASLYKKFTHIFDVTIDPQTAAAIKSFRGLPLASFLRDKLGLDPSKPIAAKVHVYEATRGTRLSHINRFEKLPGLNAQQRYGWVQLHPLTSSVASLLLKEPAMGKDLPAASLSDRFRIKPGERLYYLDIAGAKLRIPAVDHSKHKHADGGKPVTSRPSQSGDIQAVINFVKAEIRLNYYFSEEDAKSVVEKLNRNDFIGTAVTVRQSIRNVLNDILIKNVGTKVKIIHESFPELYLEQYHPAEEGFAPLAAVGKEVLRGIIEKLVEKVSEQAYQAVVNYFKARAAEFKEAQAQPQDGVTVKITWTNISGMSAIKAVISAIRGNLSIGNLADLTLPNIQIPVVEIIADKKFD